MFEHAPGKSNMLDSINLNNKSFEQIRDEAIAQIPLYSRDWTNYNVSDPESRSWKILRHFRRCSRANSTRCLTA